MSSHRNVTKAAQSVSTECSSPTDPVLSSALLDVRVQNEALSTSATQTIIDVQVRTEVLSSYPANAAYEVLREVENLAGVIKDRYPPSISVVVRTLQGDESNDPLSDPAFWEGLREALRIELGRHYQGANATDKAGSVRAVASEGHRLPTSTTGNDHAPLKRVPTEVAGVWYVVGNYPLHVVTEAEHLSSSLRESFVVTLGTTKLMDLRAALGTSNIFHLESIDRAALDAHFARRYPNPDDALEMRHLYEMFIWSARLVKLARTSRQFEYVNVAELGALETRRRVRSVQNLLGGRPAIAVFPGSLNVGEACDMVEHILRSQPKLTVPLVFHVAALLVECDPSARFSHELLLVYLKVLASRGHIDLCVLDENAPAITNGRPIYG